MSLGSFSVKTGMVRMLSQGIDANAKAIRSDLDELEREVGTLINSWQGNEQEAYRAAQTEWNAGFEALQALLTRIAPATEGLADTFDASDARGVGRWGR